MNSYCVVLQKRRRTTRCYLRARTAVQAMLLASEDSTWRVIGVEPAWLPGQRTEVTYIRPTIEALPL
jgi:hypothetical protein